MPIFFEGFQPQNVLILFLFPMEYSYLAVNVKNSLD